MKGRPVSMTSHCRIWRVMRDLARPAEAEELSALACVSRSRASAYLNELRDCGLVHISGWRPADPATGGYPAKLWVFGFGVDKPKPERQSREKHNARQRAYWRKRKKEIISAHSVEVWRRISKSRNLGGMDRIVIDGRTIYQRTRIKQGVSNEQ